MTISAASESKNAHVTYINTFTGPAVSAIINTGKGDMSVMELIGEKGISREGRVNVNGIDITFGNFDCLNISVQTRKLFDLLLFRVSQEMHYGDEAIPVKLAESFEVTVTLEDYMKMCCLKDRRNAREQLRASATTLMNLYVRFDYEITQTIKCRKKKTQKHCSCYVFEGNIESRTPEADLYINSRIDFRFSISFLEYLGNRFIMPFAIRAFTINPHKHPHAYNIMRKLTEHFNMNSVHNKPVRLSVKALIECCPELPDITCIEADSRQLSKRIREPVERDLDALTEFYCLLSEWIYCKKRGEKLSDEELYRLHNDNHYSFREWLNLMIEFKLPDFPIRKKE